jgi:subtilase family serine protease
VRQGSGVQHGLYIGSPQDVRPSENGATTLAVIPRGFMPPHMSAYLRLEGDGRGETIAIVTAYHHPTVVADLNEFSMTFDLPLVCGTEFSLPDNCINVTNVVRPGVVTDDAWALETALDVQWAHAIAPRANIIVVEAEDDELSSMMRAVQVAANMGATVISGSWGIEEEQSHRKYDSYCKRSVCVFATGNSGNPAGYPAMAPDSLAVGGTSIRIDASGEVLSEEAWSGSGGGLSLRRPRPAYQRSINPYRKRGTPDVSYHADPVRGYAVYTSVGYEGQTGWVTVGGTSAAAPQWAAIVAVSNQLRIEQGKRRLSASALKRALLTQYLGPSLHDITGGSNGTCGKICEAGPGYDFVSGMGSPRPGIDVGIAAAP